MPDFAQLPSSDTKGYNTSQFDGFRFRIWSMVLADPPWSNGRCCPTVAPSRSTTWHRATPTEFIFKPVRKTTSIKTLRSKTSAWQQKQAKVALVPTMGALHAGHLSLVKLAKKQVDLVVVSIFVNPTQFAADEDLSRYPQDEAGDLSKLADLNVDLVWAPSVEVMYGAEFATSIEPAGAALELEGAFRPHHFSGVATVCCKLFNQVRPDIAVFGEKDYQQLCVLRQMVRDLNMDLKIIAGRTVREKDGLALSSRNRYLSDQERLIAPTLSAVIKDAAKRAKEGGRVAIIEAKAMRDLARAGFSQVDYVSLRDAQSLKPYKAKQDSPGRVLAAAWLGRTRLIDNCAIR